MRLGCTDKRQLAQVLWYHLVFCQDFEKLDEIYENVESVNERLKSADASVTCRDVMRMTLSETPASES